MSRFAIAPDTTAASHKIDVARAAADVAEALLVRTIVFVGEQNCPAIEEFDGNDFSGATHLTARMNGEVVGTCRLRWFAGFAKIERVAVLRRCRGQGVGRGLIDAAKSMAAAKGYDRMLAHVEPSLVSYWFERGFAPRVKRHTFHFSDRRYLEVLAELCPDAKAIDLDTEPLIVVRPEGRWDEDGVLDLSARRAMA